MKANRVETLPLKDQFKQALEEARVILPGIQALFGFQFVAVFNSSFAGLDQALRSTHLLALSLTALAVTVTMAPAALHRQAEPECVSDRLVRISTFLLTSGMVPLGAAISLDFYVVSRIVTHDTALSQWVSLGLGAVLLATWFIFPWSVRRYLKRPSPEDPSVG